MPACIYAPAFILQSYSQYAKYHYICTHKTSNTLHIMARTGRNIKRQFARTEFLKIRISKQHLDLLNRILRDEKEYSNIRSQADIIEEAIIRKGGEDNLYINPHLK